MSGAKKINFKVFTLGCKVNQYDSAVLSNLLNPKFFFYSPQKVLNLIIINSCSVTQSAINKSRKLLLNLKKRQPQARLVLIGCWPKTEEIKKGDFDFVFSEKDLNKLAKKIEEIFFPTKNIKEKISSTHRGFKMERKKLNIIEARSRYFIKIQDGCEQFCSYCIIPLARGPLKSRSEKDILSEISLALENGFSEIVLSGIHLGLYGQDFNRKKNLSSLVKKILAIKNLGRLRLSSIEINEVSDELISLMENNDKFCKHLHISLQSGSNKILSLMNRPYTSNYFSKRITEIRKKIPHLALSTDIIVGFPGEGKKDFLETYNFAKKINFSKIHVFSFSAHQKTPAFYLPRKVKTEEIKRRSALLRALSREMEKSYQEKILKNHSNLKMLVESFDEQRIRLKSEFYFDLNLPLSVFLKKQFPDLGKNNFKKEAPSLLGRLIDYKIN